MKTLSHYTFNNSILQEKRHKTKQPYAKSFIIGAPRGNRTPNLQFRKLALCPVEL